MCGRDEGRPRAKEQPAQHTDAGGHRQRARQARPRTTHGEPDQPHPHADVDRNRDDDSDDDGAGQTPLRVQLFFELGIGNLGLGGCRRVFLHGHEPFFSSLRSFPFAASAMPRRAGEPPSVS